MRRARTTASRRIARRLLTRRSPNTVADRKEYRRRLLGRVPERRRRGPLRRRSAARNDRSRGRSARGSPDQVSGRHQISATSLLMTATSSPTASMLRPASKGSQSPAESASRGQCETTSATSCPMLSRIWASRVSRTSPGWCESMPCAPKPSLICRHRTSCPFRQSPTCRAAALDCRAALY